MFDIKVAGMDLVLKDLQSFTEKFAREQLQESLRKGMRLVAADAKKRLRQNIAVTAALNQGVSQSTGALEKAIVVRTNSTQGKRLGGAMVQVGIRGGAKKYVNDRRNRKKGRAGKTYEHGGNQYYFRFLEYGTSKMAAHPFLAPALYENTGKITNVVLIDLRDRVWRVADTLRKNRGGE
jgi:HK97 gp10 family phage protein